MAIQVSLEAEKLALDTKPAPLLAFIQSYLVSGQALILPMEKDEVSGCPKNY